MAPVSTSTAVTQPVAGALPAATAPPKLSTRGTYLVPEVLFSGVRCVDLAQRRIALAFERFVVRLPVAARLPVLRGHARRRESTSEKQRAADLHCEMRHRYPPTWSRFSSFRYRAW